MLSPAFGLFVLFLVGHYHKPLAIFALPVVAASVLQLAWRFALNQAGVDMERRWPSGIVIADDVLRRHHLRDVFWLPRRYS
jgi:hypothetical protein